MAERRFSPAERVKSALHVALLFDGSALAPISGWIIEDAAGSVIQPFYAALDSELRLCWTDDRGRAEHFGSKQAAERFALDRLTTESRIVPHR